MNLERALWRSLLAILLYLIPVFAFMSVSWQESPRQRTRGALTALALAGFAALIITKDKT